MIIFLLLITLTIIKNFEAVENCLECRELQRICISRNEDLVSFDTDYLNQTSIPDYIGLSSKSKLWRTGRHPYYNIRTILSDGGNSYIDGNQHFTIRVKLANRYDDMMFKNLNKSFSDQTAYYLVVEFPHNLGHVLYAASVIQGSPLYSTLCNSISDLIMASPDNGPHTIIDKIFPIFPHNKLIYLPDAVHDNILCYKTLHVCRVNDIPTCPGVIENLINVGQKVSSHYMSSITKITPQRSSFIDSNGLNVVFVDGRSGSRMILNEDELIQHCNQLHNIYCSRNEFGKIFSYDVTVVRSAHVLIGTHGAGLANVYFMREGSHLVEIRHIDVPSFVKAQYETVLNLSGNRHMYWLLQTKNSSYISPGEYQSKNIGDSNFYNRDVNIYIPIESFEKVLKTIKKVHEQANPRSFYQRNLITNHQNIINF